MKSKVLFSILIPNYGYSKYVFDCLDSLVNQKNNSQFSYEIIMCDQSEDAIFNRLKKEVIEKYGNPVQIYHSSFKGLFKARHNLISKSNGEYVVFVDSDDFVTSDYLLTIYNLIDQNDSDVLIFSLAKCKENGEIIDTVNKSKIFNSIKNIDVKDYFLFSSNINSVCAKVFKKELYSFDDYKDVNFDIQNGEDFVFSYPIMKKANQISYYPEIKKYYYREVSSSLTHKLDFEVCKSVFYVKDKYIENQVLTQTQKRIRLEDLMRYYSASSQNLIRQKQINRKQFKEYSLILMNKIKNEGLNDTTFLTKKYSFIYRLIKLRSFFVIWIVFKFGSLRCR